MRTVILYPNSTLESARSTLKFLKVHQAGAVGVSRREVPFTVP